MLQVLQELASGTTTLREVPRPALSSSQLLIATRRSLISPGTERMLVQFGRANWLDKARQQPEKVRQVLEKARTDGILATLAAVRSKLDQPLALGYCNVGVVAEVGAEVRGFAMGDRVASNGAHAELVAVGCNLCARVPDEVTDEEAAFTVVGAIALQGLRLATPTLGERFVVIGLGLIGLLAVQLLRAAGCRVLGIDPDPARRELAVGFGAEVVAPELGEDVLNAAAAFSAHRGVDGVLIAASTASSEPVAQAARMCRQRGRIVLIGVVGLELDRTEFYKKEISFQVSCSYGPGRYDPSYEERGQDYPFGHVRWTEQRNLEAVLDMMAAGRLNVRPLITHRFELRAAPAAYELLASGAEPHLGIILEYPRPEHLDVRARTVHVVAPDSGRSGRKQTPAIALIGAGNYASRVLMPAFKAAGVQPLGIVSQGGVSAAHHGRKFGFQQVSTDPDAMIADTQVDLVVIATRHDTHAELAIKALRAGKHVFVEKPLALAESDIAAIASAWESAGPPDARPALMVGFNRRFAPHVLRMRTLLSPLSEPKSVIITVNAGATPPHHWTQDRDEGGGRILGEACHFIDLARSLVHSPIVDTSVWVLHRPGAARHEDCASIGLRFADGSWASIHYLANGHRAFPKERIEVFCSGRILQLDNFRTLTAYGWPGFKRMRLLRQDKGQAECVRRLVEAIRQGTESPIPLAEILEVSRATIDIAQRARMA